MSGRQGWGGRGTVASLAIIAGAVLLVFATSLWTLRSAVLGAPGSDALDHLWGQWWVADQLFGHGRLPLSNELANFPEGGRFFCLSTMNAVLGAPLRAGFGLVAGFNLLVLFELTLAGWGAWWLARELTDDPLASIVAGLGFGLSPFLLASGVVSGITEALFVFPLPFVIGMARRAVLRGQLRWAVGAGVMLVLQGVGGWTTAVLLEVGLLVLLPLWFRYSSSVGQGLRALGVGGLVVLLPLVPAWLAVRRTVSGAGVMRARGLSLWPSGMDSPLAHPVGQVVPLLGPVLPRSAGLEVHTQGIDYLVTTGFLGLILLALALVGAWRARGARWALGLGALAFALSLGPRLMWTGALAGPGWPNPLYLAAYKLVPLLHETRNATDRFAVGTALGVSLAAAHGLAWLRTRARRPRGLVGAVVAGMLIELVAVSPVPWPLPTTRAVVHDWARALASEHGGAVIDVPFLEPGTSFFHSDLRLQQTAHHRPVPYAFWGRPLELASPSLRRNPWFHNLAHVLLYDAPLPPSPCAGVEDLAPMGFEYVLLHPSLIPAGRQARVRALVARCLGEEGRGEDVVIYRIP